MLGRLFHAAVVCAACSVVTMGSVGSFWPRAAPLVLVRDQIWLAMSPNPKAAR